MLAIATWHRLGRGNESFGLQVQHFKPSCFRPPAIRHLRQLLNRKTGLGRARKPMSVGRAVCVRREGRLYPTLSIHINSFVPFFYYISHELDYRV